MIANLILLFLLFGSTKWKKGPYVGAIALGLIKGILYLVVTRSIVVALMMGIAFFALAAGFVFFLGRLDKKEEVDQGYTKYGFGQKKKKMRWEYVPLSILVLIIIFGEMLLI